jgi:hypothetical protein
MAAGADDRSRRATLTYPPRSHRRGHLDRGPPRPPTVQAEPLRYRRRPALRGQRRDSARRRRRPAIGDKERPSGYARGVIGSEAPWSSSSLLCDPDRSSGRCRVRSFAAAPLVVRQRFAGVVIAVVLPELAAVVAPVGEQTVVVLIWGGLAWHGEFCCSCPRSLCSSTDGVLTRDQQTMTMRGRDLRTGGPDRDRRSAGSPSPTQNPHRPVSATIARRGGHTASSSAGSRARASPVRLWPLRLRPWERLS